MCRLMVSTRLVSWKASSTTSPWCTSRSAAERMCVCGWVRVCLGAVAGRQAAYRQLADRLCAWGRGWVGAVAGRQAAERKKRQPARRAAGRQTAAQAGDSRA